MDDSTFRIAAFFAKGKSAEDNAAFLRREFLSGKYGHREQPSGKGFGFTGISSADKYHGVCAWYDERGISLAIGSTALNNIHKVTIPWDIAAGRIEELFNYGLYVTPETLADALDNENRELSGRLWNFYRDDMDFMPEEWKAEHGGNPEDEALIKSLLDDEDSRQAILDRLEPDVNEWKYNEHERSWHSPEQLLADMRDAMIAPKSVPGAGIIPNPFKYFLTQGEIDAQLAHGSGFQDGKYRILSFFLNQSGEQERVKFLKNEYGLGGSRSSAEINGHEAYSPGKGITLTRGGYTASEVQAEINLNWPAVARRIDALINGGQYMTRSELDGIPSYEKLILAQSITNFYYDLPREDYERPFDGLDFHYPHEDEWNALNDFLYDDERIDATLEQMRYIVENTAAEDRYYDTRKTALERLTAFRDGEYTLFPGVENLVTPEAAAERQIEPPRRDNGVVINLDDSRASFNAGEPQAPAVQLSIFDAMPQLPSVEEQRERIDQSLREEAAEVKAASSVLENEIDAVLLNISAENKARLYEQFADSPRSREAVNLVKEIYGGTLPFPLPQAIKRLTELVEAGQLDGIGDPQILFEQVRNALDRRGYAVSGELVEDGINEYREQGGYGDFNAVADFIVSEYLTDESEPERDSPRTISEEPDFLSEVARIKTERDGAIVMWQVGDFYEMYGEDAKNAAAVLGVAMTEISRNAPQPYLMTGIPSHTLDEYRNKLIGAGYSVAVSSVGEDSERRLIFYEVETVKAQTEPIEPPDYDTVSQTIYDRVMADDNFAYHLQFAQSRGALRSPLNTALDRIIGELKAEEPAVYGNYFNDDVSDALFDHVYRTAWANRPQAEQSEVETETPQFTEITDPAEIAEIEAVFGEKTEAETQRNDMYGEPEEPPVVPAAPAVNFRITDDHLGEGGAKTKFRGNIDAIKVIKPELPLIF